MLNAFGRYLLVSTALSPVLGAVAVNQLALGKPWQDWLPWVGGVVTLTVMCWLMLRFVTTRSQVQPVTVVEYHREDREVVGFLLAYLLPFLSSRDMAFEGEWLTGAYVMILLVVVFAHSGSLHFNPMMGLLGYHFYAIKDSKGGQKVLITKTELHHTPQDCRVAMLTPSIGVQLPGHS